MALVKKEYKAWKYSVVLNSMSLVHFHYNFKPSPKIFHHPEDENDEEHVASWPAH